MIELLQATEKQKDIWDDLVLQSKFSTIFHTWDFLKIMEKYSQKNIGFFKEKATLHPILAFENERVIGGIPIFVYKFSFLNISSTPPFAVEDYFLGPILLGYENQKMSTQSAKYLEFIKTIDEYLKRELNSSIILIHSCPGIDDARPFIWTGYEVEPCYSSYIPLSQGTDIAWKNLSKSARRSINKGQELGIEVRDGSEHDLVKIYESMFHRERIHPPCEYIREIYSCLEKKGHIKIFVAEKDGNFLSGMVTLVHKQQMSYWIGCPKCTYLGISPNVLLMWSGIEQAAREGCEIFEIMGNDDLKLFPFKSKFGGYNIPYYNIKYYSPLFRIGHSIYRALNPRYKTHY